MGVVVWSVEVRVPTSGVFLRLRRLCGWEGDVGHGRVGVEEGVRTRFREEFKAVDIRVLPPHCVDLRDTKGTKKIDITLAIETRLDLGAAIEQIHASVLS